eukprot:5522361-Amphidinium_carterae.1
MLMMKRVTSKPNERCVERGIVPISAQVCVKTHPCKGPKQVLVDQVGLVVGAISCSGQRSCTCMFHTDARTRGRPPYCACSNTFPLVDVFAHAAVQCTWLMEFEDCSSAFVMMSVVTTSPDTTERLTEAIDTMPWRLSSTSGF